jgi:glycosyltransferase involved in cell wall biosynthesis
MTGDVEAPVVSVVLRTYNHARFVAQAIESVLIQDTAFPFELVIGEDCSTDGTREIVAAYAERHPQAIRAVLPERNVGHGAIFKAALEATRGSFIAYLDGDDYWTSAAKLQRQVDFLEANSDCQSCFHDVSLVYGEQGAPSGAVNPGLSEERIALEDILLDCFVPAPAVVFRRVVAERLPKWAFDVVWIDWLIHICAATLGPIGYIPATLAAYRVHSGGMFSALDRISQVEEDFPFYERLLDELPEQRELISRCVAYRHSQIAIERLGVPFDACVVLIDPRREMKPYFNGRHVRSLPRRDTRAVTELEAIREAAATLSTADRDYDSPIQAVDGQGRCYVVVPTDAAAWMDDHRQLVEYLDEHGQIAWADEWCAVHELSPAGAEGADGRDRSPLRIDVSMRQPLPQGLVGGFLEAPARGALLPAHAISVCGWVLGRDAKAVAVEFTAGARLLWRTPVDLERADVAEAFPDEGVATSGFQTTLNVLEAPSEAAVEVLAVLEDGSRLPFASLAPRRADVGEEQARAGS